MLIALRYLMTTYGEPKPWSQEEVQVYLDKARKQIADPRIHHYVLKRRSGRESLSRALSESAAENVCCFPRLEVGSLSLVLRRKSLSKRYLTLAPIHCS